MTAARTHRPIPLALSLLIATFSALVALAVSGGHDAHAHGVEHAAAPAAAATRGVVGPRELTLRLEMRRLWEDHVTWTRLAIVSLVAGSPDTDATVARLLRNQADIGDAIAPFYGRAAAARLTQLLRAHIAIAAEVVTAAKASDAAKLADASARWRQNADAIALFLSRANPHWPLGATRAMLREHLRLTTREAVARIQGKWRADVAAYDAIHLQALHMADMLAAGIVEQFQPRFR